MEQFGETITVSIKQKFSARKIYFFLHRKFDYYNCFDENMNFYQIPVLETDLADDDVTNELVKRGYYKREQ